MRYILHDHIGSANHGCEALVRTVSKLLGPGRTVLLSEAPEEDPASSQPEDPDAQAPAT